MTTPESARSTSGGTAGADASLFFVGNATVLLRYAGLTLLTDPNFIHRGESVGLGYGLSTTRLTDPALEIEDLPDLDAVVLSHFHGDHFDQVAEERLDRATPIVTNADAAGMLNERGFTATTTLGTWESHEVGRGGASVRITALPGRHAPAGLSIALPDVMGSLLEFRPDAAAPPGLRVYITGDTIYYEGLREIPERHPEIDVALLHLGGTRVMGVTVTMDADQGLELLETLKPPLSVPIHYDDYEAFKSPLDHFLARVSEAGLSHTVRVVRRGETLALPSRHNP